jgi:hypothetical protein
VPGPEREAQGPVLSSEGNESFENQEIQQRTLPEGQPPAAYKEGTPPAAQAESQSPPGMQNPGGD